MRLNILIKYRILHIINTHEDSDMAEQILRRMLEDKEENVVKFVNQVFKEMK
jgi:hypothetical protein